MKKKPLSLKTSLAALKSARSTMRSRSVLSGNGFSNRVKRFKISLARDEILAVVVEFLRPPDWGGGNKGKGGGIGGGSEGADRTCWDVSCEASPRSLKGLSGRAGIEAVRERGVDGREVKRRSRETLDRCVVVLTRWKNGKRGQGLKQGVSGETYSYYLYITA